MSDGSPASAGRYDRSVPGLIGAMLVSLLVIGAFVAFRAVNRDNRAIEHEPVDWLGSVRYIQSTGMTVAYPARQPEGWIATTAEYDPGDRALWDIGFLTPSDEFVGLHQEDTSIEDLVEEYVDDQAVPGTDVLIDGVTWQSFSDDGGDYALARPLGEHTLLVYGSAGEAAITDFAGTITTAPLD